LTVRDDGGDVELGGGAIATVVGHAATGREASTRAVEEVVVVEEEP